MSKKLVKLVFLIVGAAVITSACTISTSSTGNTQSIDSSIFVSSDKGDSWRAMTAVPSATGRTGSISELNVNMMAMDPADSKAIYLATYENGLFYTYDIANGWNEVKTLPKATINDVKVDPKSKCIVYAALANRVYRSQDCSRTWTQIYYDNNTEINVNTIAIDHYNTSNLYIGTSRGEIIKSIDSGNSWRTIQRLDYGVSHLIISPLDSRLVFAATVKNNIFSFTSNTNTNPTDSADLDNNFIVENWTDLNEVLKDFELGSNFKDIVVNAKDGTMFIASAKVILRSKDSGFTWENVNLIQPEKEAIINSLAVNPDDSNDIYYTTNTTFFRSIDGGSSWTTKKLPTKRAGRELLIDFKDTNMIYLGTKKI